MRTRDFPSPVEAMQEARGAGFWPRHRRDGLNVWEREDGAQVALQREVRPRSTVWHWNREVPHDLVVDN